MCNYAGLQAFFNYAHNYGKTASLPLSFVKIGKKWRVFDPLRGVYFINRKKELSSIGELKTGDWEAVSLTGVNLPAAFPYYEYFSTLGEIKEQGFQRASIQSPFKRFAFDVKEWLKR
jgi:hypothetical protein